MMIQSVKTKHQCKKKENAMNDRVCKWIEAYTRVALRVSMLYTYPHSDATSLVNAVSSTAKPSPTNPRSGVPSSLLDDMLLFF